MADFDFSTIIYLLLIALVSIFGNRKKKRKLEERKLQREQNPYEQPEQKSDSFYSIIEQLEKDWLKEEEPAPERRQTASNQFVRDAAMPDLEEFKEEQAIIHPEEQSLASEYAQFTKDKEQKYADYFDGEGRVKIDRTIHQVVTEKKRKPSPRKGLKGYKNIDLRRAVVYNEILNRPQF